MLECTLCEILKTAKNSHVIYPMGKARMPHEHLGNFDRRKLGIRQREIEEYLDENGKNPFREWILSLKDIKTRARIRMRVNRLRLGNFGDCRFLGNGVYELKIDLGPGYRIYLGRESDVILILLCGGDKKNQRKDIVKAKKLWQDYVRRRK